MKFFFGCKKIILLFKKRSWCLLNEFIQSRLAKKKAQKKNKTKLHVTCKCTIHMEFNIYKLKLLINRNGVLILFFIY